MIHKYNLETIYMEPIKQESHFSIHSIRQIIQRLPIISKYIHIRAMLHQRLHKIHIAINSGYHQRRPAHTILHIQQRIILNQNDVRMRCPHASSL